MNNTQNHFNTNAPVNASGSSSNLRSASSKPRKLLKDQTIKDNFLFTHAMLDGDNCKDFLKLILGIDVDIINIDDEKNLCYNPDFKGSRLDIFAEASDGKKYNIEMQVEPEFTELRARYYHSHMDMNMLSRGAKFKDLPESYVIFICDYDPLKLGKYVYNISSRINEAPDQTYNDGIHTIFLSTMGTNDAETPPEIIKFLNYIKASLTDSHEDFGSPLVSQLQKSVGKIKHDRSMEEEYMLLQEWLEDKYDAGLEKGKSIGLAEGRAEGEAIGLEKGIATGTRKANINTAINLVQLGISTEDIMRISSLTRNEVDELRAGKTIS